MKIKSRLSFIFLVIIGSIFFTAGLISSIEEVNSLFYKEKKIDLCAANKDNLSEVLSLKSKEINSQNFGLYCLKKDSQELVLIFGKNINEKVGIASVTKLVTAIVADEVFGQDYIFKIPSGAISVASEGRYFFGEEFNKITLLNSLLIESDNDVARTFALAYGYNEFLSKMNVKALQIGMTGSSFKNPVGLDQGSTPGTISSVSDIAKLLNYMYLNKKELLEISHKSSEIIIDQYGYVNHTAYTTNALLNDKKYKDFIIGSKTGNTFLSKHNLVIVFKDKNENIYFGVVLRSEDHFGDTRKVMDVVLNFAK